MGAQQSCQEQVSIETKQEPFSFHTGAKTKKVKKIFQW